MNRGTVIFIIAFFASLSLQAQEIMVDSTLLGKNVFSVMPAEVAIHQSQAVTNAFEAYVAANASRSMSVYRIRIFNDNKQTARAESEAVMEKMKNMFPDVTVYRSYSSPFFRVTVGDYRTKSEAMKMVEQIKGIYPTALVIRENSQFALFNSPQSRGADMDIKRK